MKKELQDLQAEQSVLGAILLDSDILYQLGMLRPECFADKKNQLIFEALTKLHSDNKKIDMLTVPDLLEKQGDLENAGNRSYLTELLEATFTSAYAVEHANIVKEKYILRSIVKATSDMQNQVYSGEDASNILDSAQTILFDASRDAIDDDFSDSPSLITKYLEDVNNRTINGHTLTGFAKYDELLGGFSNSDFIVIAARPSVGKTSFALSIAMNMILKGKKVGLFSLEMSDTQVTTRLISMLANVNMWKLRNNKLDDIEETRVSDAIGKLSETGFFMNDRAGLSHMEIKVKARKLKQEHDIDCLFIDYMQLLTAGKSENRNMEITKISQSLKALARELDIPVVALSQLSRGIEKRVDKAPVLSDLRDSGSIEQDADIVSFIHRDGTDFVLDNQKYDNVDIITLKHRNGPTGHVRLMWDAKRATFKDKPFSSIAP